ncbi:MAG TPA: hypothetical protein VMT79_10725 [Candidatus Binatia bacterium]|nr:hypothetical protein [Candidatus Binatia bacterium]
MERRRFGPTKDEASVIGQGTALGAGAGCAGAARGGTFGFDRS